MNNSQSSSSFSCGDIYRCDYRKSKSIPSSFDTLKVFSFNIERGNLDFSSIESHSLQQSKIGYCLEEIVLYLKSHNADIILLQVIKDSLRLSSILHFTFNFLFLSFIGS
jgi:hypothetical protein